MFPTPIIGFGVDFFEANSSEGLVIKVDFGDGPETFVLVDYFTDDGGTGFFGLVGSAPFTAIVIESNINSPGAVRNELFFADNLSFGALAVSEVPEPASIAVWGAFALLGAAYHRRQQARQTA
jgi:hypothetical protein